MQTTVQQLTVWSVSRQEETQDGPQSANIPSTQGKFPEAIKWQDFIWGEKHKEKCGTSEQTLIWK